jgi:DNA-binding FadR family transcriptional regulator
MEMEFRKMKVQSLKAQFVEEVESMIVSGKLLPGERLPPERELAKRMGVSRSIVNAGILDLAAKGFLTVVPRRGTFIADFRNEGTLGILTTLLHYLGEEMDDKLFFDTNLTRQVLEIETARGAAANRSMSISKHSGVDGKSAGDDGQDRAHFPNIRFHHRIAVASPNMVLCLLPGLFPMSSADTRILF